MNKMSKKIKIEDNKVILEFDTENTYKKELAVYSLGLNYIPKLYSSNNKLKKLDIELIKGKTLQTKINNSVLDGKKYIKNAFNILLKFRNDIKTIKISEDDEIDYVDRYKPSKRMPKLTKILTHCDFHTENLIVGNNNIYLIDFEQLGYSPLSLDTIKLVYNGSLKLDYKKRTELSQKFQEIMGVSNEEIRLIKHYEYLRLYYRLTKLNNSQLSNLEKKQKNNMLEHIMVHLENAKIF
jgi:5-methylthioribose kinase